MNEISFYIFNTIIPILSLAGLVFSIAILRDNWKKRNWVSNSSKAIPTKIQDALQGYVRIQGKVEPNRQSLRSPIYDRECVAYTWEVIEISRHEGNQNATIMHRDFNAIPFFINDETGKALVQCDASADLELAKEPLLHQSPFNAFPQWLIDRLNDVGVQTKGWLSHKELKVIETRLDTHESCTVIGEIIGQETGESSHYRKNEIVPIIGHGDGTLFVTDKNFGELLKKIKRKFAMAYSILFISIVGALISFITFLSFL